MPTLEFRNDGGPLLIVPRSPAPLWEGGDPPSAGRVVIAESRTTEHDVATDYDRACDVEEGAALLSAGAGWVIVLNSYVSGGEWLPLSDRPAAVAVVVGAGSEEGSASEIYARLASGTWTLLADALAIGAGGLVLMHAVYHPDDPTEYAFDSMGSLGYATMGDAIRYPLPPGWYRVEQLTHVVVRTETTTGEYVVLVRFLRQGDIGTAVG